MELCLRWWFTRFRMQRRKRLLSASSFSNLSCLAFFFGAVEALFFIFFSFDRSGDSCCTLLIGVATTLRVTWWYRKPFSSKIRLELDMITTTTMMQIRNPAHSSWNKSYGKQKLTTHSHLLCMRSFLSTTTVLNQTAIWTRYMHYVYGGKLYHPMVKREGNLMAVVSSCTVRWRFFITAT